MPFPTPRGSGPEPQLTLLHVLGDNRRAISTIAQRQQITFHSTGDCGSKGGPRPKMKSPTKWSSILRTAIRAKSLSSACCSATSSTVSVKPSIIYDQFYEPYRNYPAPVLALAGNHDGMISPLAHRKSLEAYLRNFCADPAAGFTVTPEAGGLFRTAQIQPGVFFTFDAPFVRILAFYSYTVEDPGVISDDAIGSSQRNS
jgi:hypothetical protein